MLVLNQCIQLFVQSNQSSLGLVIFLQLHIVLKYGKVIMEADNNDTELDHKSNIDISLQSNLQELSI